MNVCTVETPATLATPMTIVAPTAHAAICVAEIPDATAAVATIPVSADRLRTRLICQFKKSFSSSELLRTPAYVCSGIIYFRTTTIEFAKDPYI